MANVETHCSNKKMDEIENRLASLRLLREEVSVSSAGACSLVPVLAAIVEAAALAGISSAPGGR
ncbi:hypothetical protein [Bradyrhizobium liaoningense]|uniref:hypothetical protein n=1 Tax=Bradyrhizobium liaoningense TaxID=43992 RepID=UPI001BA6C45E|nr:hypothetical protein [Bradyrhizobium liaoningense]MBR0820280.1 hypothetical protein [Bradyrhizobium liaoningense]